MTSTNINILKAKQKARANGSYIISLHKDALNKIELDRNNAIAIELMKEQKKHFKDMLSDVRAREKEGTLTASDYVKPLIIIVAFFALSIPICFSVMDLVL